MKTENRLAREGETIIITVKSSPFFAEGNLMKVTRELDCLGVDAKKKNGEEWFVGTEEYEVIVGEETEE